MLNAPRGTRTPVLALRGPRPRPLDDGGLSDARLRIATSLYLRDASRHYSRITNFYYPCRLLRFRLCHRGEDAFFHPDLLARLNSPARSQIGRHYFT